MMYITKRIACAGLLLSGLVLMACSKSSGSDTTTPVVNPPAGTDTSLKAFMPYPFGAAVNVSLMKNNANYRNLVTKEFSSLTAENAMKFSQIHPAENTYNWADADYLVDYVVLNGKRVHGHTLIWHKNPPSWVTNFTGDSTAFENMFKNHIQTVVTHFKGKVKSWDVVNEAVDESGNLRTTSIWYQKLGPNFIARAFQYAHQADPDALLFYNDYGHEYGPTKRTAIINLVNSLKNSGVPIHGIGMQFHTRYNMTESNWASAITTAAATGLKVHISELDIALNPDNNQSLVYTTFLGDLQAQKYKYIVAAYKAIPDAQKFGITTWNVTDADSWIPGEYSRPDWPLPFDASYKRKPAYKAIIEGAK
jgi:endo-1,4-beta-xylanase